MLLKKKKQPLCTDQVVLALGNLLLFQNQAMFMFLHLGAQKWSCLNTLSSLSAEDTVNWACRSCLSVIMDPDPGTLILLTFCFFPGIEKTGLYCKAIHKCGQTESSGVPAVVMVTALLSPPLLICRLDHGEIWGGDPACVSHLYPLPIPKASHPTRALLRLPVRAERAGWEVERWSFACVGTFFTATISWAT